MLRLIVFVLAEKFYIDSVSFAEVIDRVIARRREVEYEEIGKNRVVDDNVYSGDADFHRHSIA